MKTDYKFWYITRDDNGFIVEAAVIFREGSFQDLQIAAIGNNPATIIQKYVVNKFLRKKDLKHLEMGTTKKMKSGLETILFKKSDFGEIKTEDEFRVFCNNILIQDKEREAIDIQTITDVAVLKTKKHK